MRSPSSPRSSSRLTYYHIIAVALYELLVDHLVRALNRVVGLFNLYHEHIRRSLAAERERDNLAVQAEQSAAQIQVVEVVERLHDRAGLALKIALACTAVQVAPVDGTRMRP